MADKLIKKWLDEGNAFDLVYLDFSKVFDFVNHRLLLAKLRGYGIALTEITWFESFLSRRSFQVKVNEAPFHTAEAISGVSWTL